MPKRKVRLATGRNRLKRQIREAYRLNKSELIEHVVAADKKLALFLIYIGKANENYTFIEEKLNVLLEKIQTEV